MTIRMLAVLALMLGAVPSASQRLRQASSSSTFRAQADTVPAGATARCRDGTHSFSSTRSGTCSYHGGVQAWLPSPPRGPRAEDVCNHPIPPAVWARMTADQRRYQQLADSFTTGYMKAVFGSGPYPPCLYQSVRDYFTARGSSEAERTLAQERRKNALSIMRCAAN